MNYKKIEKTIISMEGATATVWTSNPHVMRRLERWSEEQPMHARLTRVHRIGQGKKLGEVDWQTYEIRACLLQFFEPDEMTAKTPLWDVATSAEPVDDSERFNLMANAEDEASTAEDTNGDNAEYYEKEVDYHE